MSEYCGARCPYCNQAIDDEELPEPFKSARYSCHCGNTFVVWASVYYVVEASKKEQA